MFMKKTHLVLILTLGFTLTGIIAATSRASRDYFVDSETQILLDLKAKNPTDKGSLELLKGIEALQERDRKINAWLDLPQAELDKVIADKEDSLAKNKEQMRENEAKLGKTPLQIEPIAEWELKGIHEESLNDSVDLKAYRPLNYWTSGRAEGTNETPVFSAGYKFEDPLQGLVEYHVGWERNFKYYPSPTATGPLKVVSEKDGILTLISVAGEYPKRDLAGENREVMVKTPGVATYFFDTKTLTFIR